MPHPKAATRPASAPRNVPPDPAISARRYVLGGLLTVLVMVVGIGGWATITTLSGAVIAQGVVVVETSVKKVQHPTGGIIGEIRVKEGERVTAGDRLIRLDETIVRANLQIVSKQLDELLMREARLIAERDDAQGVIFSGCPAAAS
jgi:HlyD family secretion protein